LWHSVALKKAIWFPLVVIVVCPTCGAACGEKCELHTGQPRTQPHAARRWAASDKLKILLSGTM
jgi:hypothetical protein